MRVEIWSDVVCPWCYIGQERFAKGLVFRSFELDPQHPEGETEPVAEVLAKKYGVSMAEARQAPAPCQSAEADGAGLGAVRLGPFG
jgi:predicted DsbA family dithiol-disulfide isomerase